MEGASRHRAHHHACRIDGRELHGRKDRRPPGLANGSDYELLSSFLSLPALLYVSSPLAATLLLVPIGFILSAPFGPMVVLGQSYLPQRVGLASGITLGLAFSFGGLTTPLLGWVGDHHGLRALIGVVACMPLLCLALTLVLPSEKSMKNEAQPASAGY